jgi:hypothetical protein
MRFPTGIVPEIVVEWTPSEQRQHDEAGCDDFSAGTERPAV